MKNQNFEFSSQVNAGNGGGDGGDDSDVDCAYGDYMM